MLGFCHQANKPPGEPSYTNLQQTFGQCRGQTFVPGRNSAVIFDETFYKLKQQEKEPARYRSASLGDEPVTIVITTVCSIAPQVNCIVKLTIVTGSSPRLAKLAKVNDGTSSGNKCLPSALTKCPPALPLSSLKLSLQARQLPLDSQGVEKEDLALC